MQHRTHVGALVMIGSLAALSGLAGARPRTTLVSTARMQYAADSGITLATPRRYALYMTTADKKDKSQCYGACAETYPPLLTSGSVAVKHGSGLNPKLLGKIRRKDGKLQVTYNHHPLYTATDSAETPGEAGAQGCQADDGHGVWWVLDKKGNPIKNGINVCGSY
jgi:predicted lipoprotein with Yx(FWY)xxD motif